MADAVQQVKAGGVGPGGDSPAPMSPDTKSAASPAPPSPMPVSPAPPSPAPQNAASPSPVPQNSAPQSPAPQNATSKSPAPQSPAPLSPAPQSPACQSPVPGSDSPTSTKSGGGETFRDRFKAFSKFGDTKSDGKHITLSQSDKWMKQAKVIDGKKITTTDTGIYFKKFKAQKIGFEDYKKFLDELSKNKKVDVAEMKSKMASCGQPGLTGVTAQSVQAAAVERLTDTSRYTGSHRQRFDETGKGKGIAGRKDIPDGSGYVQGYMNKDSYRKNR